MALQVEWQALMFIRVDHRGFLQHVAQRGLVRPSLTSRLEFEIGCWKILLSETVGFQPWGRARVLEYVSVDGLPPDWDLAPGYYGI